MTASTRTLVGWLVGNRWLVGLGLHGDLLLTGLHHVTFPCKVSHSRYHFERSVVQEWWLLSTTGPGWLCLWLAVAVMCCSCV
jgi:hypothetical protein